MTVRLCGLGSHLSHHCTGHATVKRKYFSSQKESWIQVAKTEILKTAEVSRIMDTINKL